MENLSSQPSRGRLAVLLAGGLTMAWFSVLTIGHYYSSNFPKSIDSGSICDINSFFNCDSSAFSALSAIGGVPLGFFGAALGALVCLGALFPERRFLSATRVLLFLNLLGVLFLLGFSVFYLGSLCLLCTGYYVGSAVTTWALYSYGAELTGIWKPLLTFGAFLLIGSFGLTEYTVARKEALAGGTGSRIVRQFFALPTVPWPSLISPYWTAQSSPEFEDAPIRVVEFADFLCSDCRYMRTQLDHLEQEFAGKLNVAFQFFPLDAECNQVVDKDKHPGACALSQIAAQDPAKFREIHDEIFDNMQAAKQPEWIRELARRHGLEGALTDPATRQKVVDIIETGREYAQTSEKYPYGIRSTPTMIINNRMIIGTLPYDHLRAIFQAILDGQEIESGFIENWVELNP